MSATADMSTDCSNHTSARTLSPFRSLAIFLGIELTENQCQSVSATTSSCLAPRKTAEQGIWSRSLIAVCTLKERRLEVCRTCEGGISSTLQVCSDGLTVMIPDQSTGGARGQNARN